MTLRPLLTLTALNLLMAGVAFTLAMPAMAQAPVAKPSAKATAKPTAKGQAKAPAQPAASAASDAQGDSQGIEPVEFNPDDPDLIKASVRARAALPRFFAVTSAPGAQVNNVAVRVLLSEGKQHEFVWVMPFDASDGGKNQRFEGTVNDLPRKLKHVATGQQISFKREDIVDWMYSDTHSGRLEGHFTTCVLLRKAPAEEQAEAKRSLGLDCDR